MSSHLQNLIEIGKVSRLHGYKGSVVVFTPTGKESALGQITAVWIGSSPSTAIEFKIQSASWMPKGWKIDLSGICSEESAERLIGSCVYADRPSLPALNQNEYYLSDLINLIAYDCQTKKVIGSFVSLEESSSDQSIKASYWVFKTESGTLSVPAVGHFIHSVDLKEKKIWLQNMQDLP